MTDMVTEISEVSAKEQLDLLLDHYDVDLSILDNGKLQAVVELKLIKAILEGKLEITQTADELLVIQTIKDGTEFKYHEITGMAKVQMERFKGQHERLYALLGFLAKKKPEQIQKISGVDLTIAEYLGLIFLAG